VDKKVVDLLKTFSSNVFRVSTIFCALEEGAVAQSFKLFDKDGKERTKENYAKPFMISFATSVANRSNAQLQNLFVLGYTISQTSPSMAQYAPDIASHPQPTPSVFIPRSFGVTLSGGDSYTKGTLNFCMLTNRWKAPPKFETDATGRSTNIETAGAGLIQPTFFDTMKVHAQPASADGIMVFSQDIFVNHWIGGLVAPGFRIDMNKIGKSLTTKVKEKIDGDKSYSSTVPRPSGNGFGTPQPTITTNLSENNEYTWKAENNYSKRVFTAFVHNSFIGKWQPTSGLELFSELFQTSVFHFVPVADLNSHE
jgi:hypothetical protein